MIERLLEGNRRYAAGRSSAANASPARRRELVAGQAPAAAVLCCSDSRVPPEIIFDCGLGELFVVRVAGNVIDPVVLDSLEYAVDHLGVQLVVVLGHNNCGAVTAACAGGHSRSPGHLADLLCLLGPAVEAADALGRPATRVDDAVAANVRMAVQKLEQHLGTASVGRGLLVVGALYDLESGVVSLL
ncbi:MAG: carbonic anhydrase [Gaiellales bacterium]|nr:carbonic anhydrase [Gaiellales bacterium]